MSDNPTETFIEAVKQRRAIPGLLRDLENRTYIAASAALVDEVKRRKPKAPVPKELSAVPMFPPSQLADAKTWARKHMPADDVETFVAGFAAGAQADHLNLQAVFEGAKEVMEQTALLAVFPAEPGVETVVYRDTDHRNQPGPGWYQEAACRYRIAVLEARGFKATMRPIGSPKLTGHGVSSPGYEVVADAPEAVAEALPYWRLDPDRLLANVGAANLKVLFSPYFPYAGFWDWPKSARYGRDDPDFQLQRASEDAHLAVNRPLPPPPPYAF